MNTTDTTTQAETSSPAARATKNEPHRHSGMPIDGEHEGFLSARSVGGMTTKPRWDQ